MKRHPIPAQFRSHHPHPCDGRLPADLNAVLQQRVTEAAEATLELSRGETLVHSGMPFKHLYLVVSGGFKAVEIGEDGQSQIVSFHYARELMGLSGFAQQRYTTDLVALAPSLICEFPMAAMQSIVGADRILLNHLLTYVSESLARAEQDQFRLGSMSATQKIASFLLHRQTQLREAGEDDGQFELLMTREEMGSYLGLSMETISRLLSYLQEQGVVRVDKRQVQILKEDELRVWLDGAVNLPTCSRRKPAAQRAALKLA